MKRVEHGNHRCAGRVAAAAALATLMVASTSLADDACFDPSAEKAAAQTNWSFTAPACSGQLATASTTAPTPIQTASSKVRATGDAPTVIPYLRYPAGGDPVMADGEFVEARTDVALAGYGVHYEFARLYRSRVNFKSVLGYGWDHSYDQRLLGVYKTVNGVSEVDPNCDHSVDFQDGQLNRIHFAYAYSASDGEYYTAPGTSYTLHTQTASTGGKEWILRDAGGTFEHFNDDGYLSSIVDAAGNSLTFAWELSTLSQDDAEKALAKTVGPTRRLTQVADASRQINYIYSTTGTLQCVTLGTDCTANDQLLVSFQISAPTAPGLIPAGPELLGVTHGTETNGEQYTYWDQTANPVNLPFYYEPAGCLDSTQLAAACTSLCAAPDPANPATCGYANMNQRILDFCNNNGCDTIDAADLVQQTPNSSKWEVHPCHDWNQASVALQSDGDFHCDPAWQETVSWCSSLSGNWDGNARRPDWPADNAPCCRPLGGHSWGADALCLQYLGFGTTECETNCLAQHQCRAALTSDGWQSIYAYGDIDELRHDIVTITDQKGAVVVQNTYGVDPRRFDFDKVTTQNLGPGTVNNATTFEYHDLQLEAGTKTLQTYDPTSGQPVTANQQASTSNPIVVNPYASDASWNPEQLCPWTCNVDGGCEVLTYLSSVPDSAGAYQNPTSAVVITDLHNRTRVQYLDAKFNILREIATDTTETTDYNYDANGFVQAVRAASGVRTCLQNDNVGRLWQSTKMPAPGYSGNAVPFTTFYSYSAFGQLASVTTDYTGTPSTVTYHRDPTTDLVIEVDQDVGGGKPALKTVFAYDNTLLMAGYLETPSQITYPNGRIDLFYDFDLSMGGPKTTVIDSTSPTPENRYAVYDGRGRVVEQGETDRYAEHYGFDEGGRLKTTSHRMDSSSPWIATTTTSHESAGITRVDSVVTAQKTASYQYNANQYPNEIDLVATSAPAGSSLPATQKTCFGYSADGRLEAVALPEGNIVHYDYWYDSGGTSVVVSKGYTSQAADTWNANCPSATAPSGSPNYMQMIGFAGYNPGGFPSSVSDHDVFRVFVDDGFGNIIQSNWNYFGYAFGTPVDQYGYDSRGRVIWHAVYSAEYGMAAPGDTVTPSTPYHNQPLLSDPGLQSLIQFEYDFVGRVVREHHWVVGTAEDLQIQHDYNDQTGTLIETDRGVATSITYDGRGRQVAVVLPDRSSTTTQHNLGTDVVTVQTNVGMVVRTLHYDTRGMLLETDDENNNPLSSETYDDDGNALTATPAGAGTTTNVYDSFDRLVSSKQDLGNGASSSSSFGWDRNNRAVAYSTEQGTWSKTYTGFDGPSTTTDPLNRTGTYLYVPGYTHVSGVVEPNGRQSSFKYGEDFQLTDIFEGLCSRDDIQGDPCTPLQARKHYDYTADGTNVALVSSPAVGSDIPVQASVSRTYDSVQRLVDERVGTDSLVHHDYTDAGRTVTTSVIYFPTNAMATMTHRHDAVGRLSGVDVNSTNIATWNYGTGVGGPLTLSYANGAATSYQYDSRLRPTGLDVTLNGSTIASLHDAYGRDSTPRLRQRQFGGSAPQTDAYQVDGDGRMAAESLRVPGISLPLGELTNADVDSYMSLGATQAQYKLDGSGNIRQRISPQQTTDFTMDALSRVTAVAGNPVAIDGRDNLTSAGQDVPAFTFDEFTGDVLTGKRSNANSIAPTSYDYDALDRRIAEHDPLNVDTLLIWNGEQLIAHGSASDLILEVPTDDIDGHVASIDHLGNGAVSYYHQGPDQSVLALSSTQALLEGYSYSAFGEVTVFDANGQTTGQSTSTIGNRFLFQGQWFDPQTGTYAARARQYIPTWGRFLSPDPLSILAGPSLYSFTGARPLSSRDPLGLQATDGYCRDGMTNYCLPPPSYNGPGLDGGTGGGDPGTPPDAGVPSPVGSDGNFNAPGSVGGGGGYGSGVSGPGLGVGPGARAGLSPSTGAPSAAPPPIPGWTPPVRYNPTDAWDGFRFRLEQQAVDHPWRLGGFIFGTVFVGGVAVGVAGGVVGTAAAAEAARGGRDIPAGIQVTQRGLDIAEKHLARFGDYSPNNAMLQRLQNALNTRVTGADADFYLHEISESTMMENGMGYEEAHAAALEKYGVSNFGLYHPDVILSFPEEFNSAWRAFWGL